MVTELLNILRQISEIIARNDNYNVVLSQIVNILATNLQVDVCSVYVYNEQRDTLILKATHGLNAASVDNVEMKPGEGLTGTSFKKREIMNVVNPEQHPQFVFFQNTGEEKYKSFLSVPLTVGGKCVGILTLQSKSEKRFQHEVIDMVKSLSTQLANMILNALMLENLNNDVLTKKEHESKAQIMLRGISANPGTAHGKALIFESRDVLSSIAHANHSDVQAELKLFENSVKLAKQKTIELEKLALSMISEADASIFYVHVLFLEDKSFLDHIRKEITENTHTLEFSIKLVFLEYQKRFMSLNDQSFRDRVMDLKDVMLRLLESAKDIKSGKLEDKDLVGQIKDLRILIAEELLPSDLLRMPIANIAGIVCEKGGVTAHVAILAKALNIPALMGVKDVSSKVRNSDDVILDCHSELMYIRPGEQICIQFEEMINTREELETQLDSSPSTTSDGVPITLRGNISLICETSMLAQYGAKGIGLYRTEFLYMIRDYMPSEEEQYRVFARIFQEADGEDVTIRVLDTGGDKPLPYFNFPREDNPALGYRGIRLLLSNEELFKTHLRAILRAGVFGKLKILFPMVSTSSEVFSIRQALSEVENELHEKNIKHSDKYDIGIMLEVPSVLFGLEKLIEAVDYMSIGSNDLLQYVFAIDRGNELVADKYQVLHPIFLKIISQIAETFQKYPDKYLAICGEMAGNPMAVPFLIGAGIKDLSMSPVKIPAVKSVIKAFTLAECKELLDKALILNNPESVSCLIKEAFADKNIKAI